MREAVSRIASNFAESISPQLPEAYEEIEVGMHEAVHQLNSPTHLAQAEQSASQRYADVSVDELLRSIESMVATAAEIERGAKAFIAAWRDGASEILERARGHKEIMESAKETLAKLLPEK